MKFIETKLSGCFVIDLEPIADLRGSFARAFCAQEFTKIGLNPEIAQTSISTNVKRGTLRALHFQRWPHMEDKLVRCTSGAIFDVAVDLRLGSPTYGQWISEELTATNNRQLYIPKGFAHGFQTLTDNAVVFYSISQFYHPENSVGVRFDDPEIAVNWPLPPVGQSVRDLALPRLSELSAGFLMVFPAAIKN